MKTTQIAIIRRLVKFGHLPWNTMVAVKKKKRSRFTWKRPLKTILWKDLEDMSLTESCNRTLRNV